MIEFARTKIWRFVLAYIIILYFTTPVFSQTWLWAKNSVATGIIGEDVGVSVATDASGNIYTTGGFQSSNITLGSYTLTNAGGQDMFLAKYDSSGNVLWAKSAGGFSYEVSNSVTTDVFGNVYITGCFNSPTITFGTITLINSSTSAEIFLVKYDAFGNVLWAKKAGGVNSIGNDDMGNSVATDAAGNVYITGIFGYPSITFGTTTLTYFSTSGHNNVFIAKYDALGNVLWAKNGTGTYDDYGINVCTDAANNVYLAGNFYSSTITFGTTTLINYDTVSGYSDVFLVKYDASGNVLWAKTGNGSLYDNLNGVTTDAAGNVWITGHFFGPSISFGTTALVSSEPGALPWHSDVFVVKYDLSGNLLWAKSAGGVDQAQPNGGTGLSADPLGNVYVAGRFTPSITFGPYTLYDSALLGYNALFIVKYDPAGNELCASALQNGGPPQFAVAADVFGNAYVCGSYYYIDTFSVGATNLARTGTQDIFVAKYTCGSIVTDTVPVATECGTVYIPNAFTPNNSDLLNDVFKPVVNCVHDYSFLIFDRWGEKIFETTNQEESWNGYYMGSICKQDVYVYRLLFRDNPTNEFHQAIGKVTLLR